MIVLSAIALLFAAYFGFSLYIRKARQFLDRSQRVWDDLYETAGKIVGDPDMPGGMAAFAAAAVLCAGCGCLTVQILRDYLTGAFAKRLRQVRPLDYRLTDEQRALFARVVGLAIYYDSLQAPFMGFLLRRLVMPWLADAAQGKPVSKRKVAVAAESSREAIGEKPEGRRVLALA